MHRNLLITIGLVLLFGTLTALPSADVIGISVVATATVELQQVIYLPLIMKPLEPPKTPNPPPTPPILPQVNDLKIVRIVFEGRDELVEVINNGPGNQLMDGWRIVSVVGSQTYDFPSGITLAAGQSLRVHSGPDAIDNPPGDLRWTTAFVWNNKGDNGELWDHELRVRDALCYGEGCSH